MGAHSGRRIVEMVWEDLRLSDLLTRAAFRNAIVTVLAIGGSTNAIIHLIAMARRIGVELSLADFEELARVTPLMANIRPSGKYLMEDFFYAGGLPALLKELGDLLDTSAPTANGQTLGENVARAKVFNEDVIRTRRDPIVESNTLAVLRGNLAPDGAVIKPAAAEERLHRHTGPAVVFENYDDMAARIDDPDLDIDENSVIVLKSAGPQGAPGMPEWGQLPIPKKILEKGIRDMVRISDARMSGTSYGTCVLHVCPESRVGGPLALVRDGDVISIDLDRRALDRQGPAAELAARREALGDPPSRASSGYLAIYRRSVQPMSTGAVLGRDE
jgi:dihydroxy-acid dehydratase